MRHSLYGPVLCGRCGRRRWQRRAANTEADREVLLSAAAFLFGSRGYHDTSMREIASHAGFSTGALYERFDSKDAMYCEVVRTHFQSIWQRLDRALALHRDCLPRLLAITGAIFDHVTQHRSFLRLSETHPPTVSEPYQSEIRQMQKPGARAARDHCRDGPGPGRRPDARRRVRVSG